MEYIFYFTPSKYDNYKLITYGTNSKNCKIISYGDNGVVNVLLIGVRWVEDYNVEEDDSVSGGYYADDYATFFKDEASALRYVVKCKKEDILAIEEEIELLEKRIEKL